MQGMKRGYVISIYLDTRRVLKSGKYPVKLRVFTGNPRKQKLYATVIELSKEDFSAAWENPKPRGEHKELRFKLQGLEQQAVNAAESLSYFSFEDFEKKLYRNVGDGKSITWQFEDLIKKLNANNQVGTASSYSGAQNSISNFSSKILNRKLENTPFHDITPEFLSKYERYMTEAGKSITTIGMYLRALRAVFNKAIEEKEISVDIYPFGKRKYQIPASVGVKKALNKDQLKSLFQATPKTAKQEKAKDFFFFSYACNGMNIRDICMLKKSDVKGDSIEFLRAKTRLTSKSKLKTITAYLNEFCLGVINKYKADTGEFLFPILDKSMDATEQLKQVKSFAIFINQHIEKICKDNNLPVVTTYWARHSFATNAIRKGASIEFVQESLGHTNTATTQAYFAGFDDESKKDFANNIMNFD